MKKNIVSVRRKYKEMIGKVSTECRQNVDSLLSKAQMKKNIVSVRRKYKEMIGKMSTECRQNVDSLLSKH